MTIVHVFWDDGQVSSYTFANKRVVYAFLDEIHAFDEADFGGDGMVCKADKRRGMPARIIARRLGSTDWIARRVVSAQPP